MRPKSLESFSSSSIKEINENTQKTIIKYCSTSNLIYNAQRAILYKECSKTNPIRRMKQQGGWLSKRFFERCHL